MKNTENIVKSIFAAILFIIVIALIVGNIVGARNEYNNGICKECGEGHFHLVSAPTQTYKMFVYACDTCGNEIATFQKLR